MEWIVRPSLVLLALFLATGVGAQPTWLRFAQAEGRFLVEMPQMPQATTNVNQSPVGPIVDHSFTCNDGDVTYTVEYSDLPRVAILFAGVESIYDKTRGALLLNVLGKQSAYADAPVSGHPGKTVVYTTPAAEPQVALNGQAWLLLVGNRLYVVNATAPEANTESARRLLKSFQLTHD